jgi:hypothetical protein
VDPFEPKTLTWPFAGLAYHSEWRADCVTRTGATGGAADRSGRGQQDPGGLSGPHDLWFQLTSSI